MTEPWWTLKYAAAPHCSNWSRRYCERAIELAERFGDPLQMGHRLAGLGAVLFLLGEWSAARSRLERAAELLGSLGWTLVSAAPLLGLAQLSLAEGHWEEVAQ